MKSLKDTRQGPRDPYNLVYILFYYISIGTLLPWNFFINVSGYWMFKFRTVENSTVGWGHGMMEEGEGEGLHRLAWRCGLREFFAIYRIKSSKKQACARYGDRVEFLLLIIRQTLSCMFYKLSIKKNALEVSLACISWHSSYCDCNQFEQI